MYFIAFSLIFIFPYKSSISNLYAEESSMDKFAQIQKEGVFLYYSPNGKPIFEIPATYYVELLQQENEQGFYKAKYLEQIGYVKSADIQCVQNAPPVPFLTNINFRILASQSAELRSEPSRSNGINSLLCELDLYETNFIYYGEIQGEEVVSKRGDIWYFCSYTKNNSTLKGYVYAGLTDQMKEIYRLSLDANPIDAHDWSTTKKEDGGLGFTPPSSSQLAIILCISIPVLLLIIALFKPVRTASLARNKKLSYSNSKQSAEQSTITKHNIIELKPNPKRKSSQKASKGKDFYEL